MAVVPPFAALSLPHTDFAEGARFALTYRELTNAGGGSHVGVCLEELPPGKQGSPAHYHLLEEEHIYVLAGSMTVLLGDAEYPMVAGDYVCFPAGQAVAHAMINRGSETCRYLVIGERNPHDVIIYPENNRVSVRLTAEGYEKTPVPYWHNIKTT